MINCAFTGVNKHNFVSPRFDAGLYVSPRCNFYTSLRCFRYWLVWLKAFAAMFFHIFIYHIFIFKYVSVIT